MILTLWRRWLSEEWTIGELEIDGLFFCYTLEDRVREPGIKVPKLTAIAPGEYRVIFLYSRKHQRRMPYLVGVPDFSGIQIHAGDHPDHSEGCILVGADINLETGRLSRSRITFGYLMERLLEAMQSKAIYIRIENAVLEDRRVSA